MKTTITVVRSGFGNVADKCWFDQKYKGGLPYHEKEVELPEGWSVVDDGAEPYLQLTTSDPIFSSPVHPLKA